MAGSSEAAVLLGCGDIGPMQAPTAPYSELIRPVLESADLRFAQCERTYSTRGNVQVVHEAHEPGHMTRLPPSMISVFTECKFDVVSVASNVALNWGPESHVDTVDLFRHLGIQTVGGGRNIVEARMPAILVRKGVRVGFLGYCSIVREGYEAGPEKAGVAPMRTHTYYEPVEYQPGLAPKVLTIPYSDDLAALEHDIEELRPHVDALVVSFHWGIQNNSRDIGDYQHVVMRTAIEHGADLILGHHPHRPKGIEVYRGVPCFYGMSNFIMTTDKEGRDPTSPYGEAGKRGYMVRAELTRAGVQRVGFLPLLIDGRARPEVLRDGDPRFKEALDYLEWCSEGLPHQFKVDGDEVLVS